MIFVKRESTNTITTSTAFRPPPFTSGGIFVVFCVLAPFATAKTFKS
jgi:hypothetical protein